jgi:hypothetical protein
MSLLPAMGRTPRSRAGELGQGLVEFVVVIPIFLFMVFAIFDVGRVILANNALAAAAREGARYAIVHGGSETNTCPVGPPGPHTVIPAASASCPHPSPSKESIRDAVRRHAIAAGTGLTITVCYGSGCTGDTDAAGATNVRGTPVTVRVTSQVSLVAGSFLGLGNFTPSASSTMLVNH